MILKNNWDQVKINFPVDRDAKTSKILFKKKSLKLLKKITKNIPKYPASKFCTLLVSRQPRFAKTVEILEIFSF
jgi:hypothetical protein